MSLAVPTLTLIFLLAPGIAFRRGYFSGYFSQRYFRSTFGDLLIASIVPAILIHVLIYPIFNNFYQIDAKTLGLLMTGVDDPAEVKASFAKLYYHAKEIFLYVLCSCVMALGLGASLQILVRGFRLDRRYEWLRFKNEWHYLFTGEILDFPGQPGFPEDVDFVYVDVLMDCNQGSVIYSGILTEHFLGKDGGLDKIYLADARRRYLTDDLEPGKEENVENENPDRYYAMPGHLFCNPIREGN